MQNLVRVGIGVLIFKDNQILLGKRKNAHGDGCWALPGGHLEFGETPEQCAIREVAEETGLEISNVYPGPFTNDIFQKEQKHYITIFMIAKYNSGQPKIMEKDKCSEWIWCNVTNLPKPLFQPLENLINLKENLYNLKP